MLDKLEFYYNGRWSSEFGVYIGGKEGYSITSLKPQKTIKTEEVLGKNGVYISDMKYLPRALPPIPLILTRTDDASLFNISTWLESLEPSDFYFKGDNKKLKVVYDNALDSQDYMQGSLSEIKFIAHDPYYYAIEDRQFKFTSGFNSMIFINDGNTTSLPLINIKGSGEILVSVNGTQSFTVKNVVDEINIDSLYKTCYKGATNLFDNKSGDWIELLAGQNTISVSGTVTEVSIQCRSRWI